jgi:hypothetical protein
MLAPSAPAVSRASSPVETGQPAFVAGALTVLLVAILAANLPGLVCMPLDADVSLWDLFARTVHDGGVAYRDLKENNFPGMLWAHLAVRAVFGWRPEFLRVADAGVVAAIVVLLASWLPAGCVLAWRLFAAVVLASFYLITSEWCHVQRDTWMLLPALLALGLRHAQLTALAAPHPVALTVIGRGVAEGVLWAMAFWVKPFVAVPCLLCWLTGARHVLVTTGRGRWLLVDGSAVLAGGLLAGAAGCAWLLASGAWVDFWDVMLVWNREYVRYDMGRDIGWLYPAGPLIRLAPWPLVHVVAVPVAAAVLWRRESPRRQLLAAMYLGWLGQAVFFQHIYDYIHVPPLLLGISVLCQQIAFTRPGLGRTLLLALLLLGIATRLPAVTARRLACWSECLRDGSSLALRDRLSLMQRMSWAELEEVRAFLQTAGPGDGELTTLSMRTVPLYQALGLRPSSPYPFLENTLLIYPRQHDRVCSDLASSRQRYVVCDVLTVHWRRPAEVGDRSRPTNPESAPFPGRGLLFRAGRYAIYDVPASDMPAWIRDNLDL